MNLYKVTVKVEDRVRTVQGNLLIQAQKPEDALRIVKGLITDRNWSPKVSTTGSVEPIKNFEEET